MKKNWAIITIAIITFGLLLLLVLTLKWANRYISITAQDYSNQSILQKVYIANEWESAVSVIDTSNNTVIKTIDLSEQYYGKFLSYKHIMYKYDLSEQLSLWLQIYLKVKRSDI